MSLQRSESSSLLRWITTKRNEMKIIAASVYLPLAGGVSNPAA
jgi:hypothetical protein